jgi:aryl-alcohol dehydrogenase-like predicted oxidoreductase
MTMERRRCGRHDLELPVLGMGCWSFGGGEYWGAQDQKDVDEVVREAIDRGCNFFDTAEAYNGGTSERSLGAALKGIPRDRVLIGTKISPSHTRPDQVVAHCDASLQRLQTDYIDLYIVHWPITAHSIRHFTKEPIATPGVSEAFAALGALQKAGKIRHLGVSNFGAEKLSEALALGARIAINELPFSLLTRAIEFEILPFCRENGIGVLGYMSLMQGVLSDKYPTFADIPEWRRRTRHFDSRRTPQCRHGLPGHEPETAAARQAIRAIAKKHGMTTQEIALKWAFAGEGITSSLCGSRDLAQLRLNIEAAAAPLDPAVADELTRATEPLKQAMGPSFDYYESPADDRTK